MKDSEKIKVHLLASPHPQFDEIIDFPPAGVSYEINRVKTGYHNKITENKIRLHNTIMNFLPLPRMAHTKTDASLIHSTRGILQIFQKKPWIVDCESGGIFTSFNYESLNRPLVKTIIKRALSSKNCKKILPQSEAAKKDLLNAIDCKSFIDKIEVLYLAMRPCEKKKVKRNDNKIVLSFVGWAFYPKGGHDLIKAYEILTKKYSNLELRYKGEIPEEYLDLAKSLPGFRHVEGFLPRDKLFDEMYLNSDIFVLPTTVDNYGVVFLEALSAGLPLVGTKSFTVPELIEDGKNGFIVDIDYSWEDYLSKGEKKGFNEEQYEKDIKKEHPETITQLVEKISKLVENKSLREKMGKESRKMIEDEDGKFSISARNKKLKRIYEEALK